MSDERLPDVWTARDFPVLRELARHFDQSDDVIYVEAVADAVGIDAEAVRRAGRALERRGLVGVLGAGEGTIFCFNAIAGAAYLMTGLHPDGDDALTALVAMLRQAADQTSDEDERGRLKRAADGLVNASGKVMQGVLTAYLTGVIPR